MVWTNAEATTRYSYDFVSELGLSADGIRDHLATLTGTNRLSATAIKDLPAAGLDAAGVRDQISSAIVAGTNITITPTGTGATRTFTVSSSAAGPSGGVTLAQIEDFAEVGNSALVPATKVGPVGGETNLQDADTKVRGRLTSLETFKEALKQDTTIANGVNVQIGTSNTGNGIPGVDLPAQTPDAELTLTVSGKTGSATFLLATLRSRPTTSQATTFSASNSVEVTIGGTKYYIGHQSSGELIFSSENVGTHTITLVLTQIAPQIPRPTQASKFIGTDASGNVEYKDPPSTPTGGLNQAAVDARIAAQVEDFAEDGQRGAGSKHKGRSCHFSRRRSTTTPHMERAALAFLRSTTTWTIRGSDLRLLTISFGTCGLPRGD